ncbi:MAG: hypothetical protein LBC47_00710 [Tannerella sp.]|jgi:hypothetical protein|nr:hypothetical protein [Tannerella sp.]
MKKIVLFISCYIITSLCITAEGRTREREPYKLKREITVRWGAVNDILYSNTNWFDYYYWTPLERYNGGKYYYDDKIYTQAISLSYTQELKRWLALSVNAVYSGISQNKRSTETNQISDKYRKYHFSIYPAVRFTYFNRPVIRLYSAVGLGLGITDEKWSNDYQSYNRETNLGGQITFFGVSVGKNLFALWETGVGDTGYFLIIGGGYRF